MSNKLLSEDDSAFREAFHKLLMSFNESSLVLTMEEITLLYDKMEKFVRGVLRNIKTKEMEVSCRLGNSSELFIGVQEPLVVEEPFVVKE